MTFSEGTRRTCAEFFPPMRHITIKRARTWHYRKMRLCIEQSNDLAPLSPFRSWLGCITNTSGYDGHVRGKWEMIRPAIQSQHAMKICAAHGTPIATKLIRLALPAANAADRLRVIGENKYWSLFFYRRNSRAHHPWGSISYRAELCDLHSDGPEAQNGKAEK
jgi:hypothetical protein